ncbi:mitochondrial ribonuclease P protein 1 homolog [Dermatophagoides pteronyssinus]|uniref:RNA (guanine-9-)-methyltransferase domain-containing protein 1 n=1 Tax=Dermatophagoides pteronyssinus TaxID=6956 RepID=A0A6P6XW72_DERPT|nr:mitochondrial ribonuclease P protein 1 homolog [Dermatophagoides pteronyssinus]
MTRLINSLMKSWTNSIVRNNGIKRDLHIMAVSCKDQQQKQNPTPQLYENARQFKEVTVNQFQMLFKTNPKCKGQIEEILNLYELEKYTTQQVPSILSVNDMKRLLSTYDDEKELRKMIKFFYTRECDKFNTYKKKFYKKQEMLEKKREKYGENDEWEQGVFDIQGHLVYGLWHNSLISRITKQAIRDYRSNHISRQTCLFGQKLIVDLDYDQYMKPSEIGLLAKQISIMYYENRVNRDYPESLPYDVHFTNCRVGENTVNELSRHLKRMDDLKQYYFHPESYLSRPDLFPKNKLIYLSPHAKLSLKQYDHDDIFILGGYNDRSSHRQVSHVKAQSEGIRCYRLPLDENVLWKQGDKNLCLNQVAAILHAVKATGDWQVAIRKFAPQRKVRSLEEQHLEDQIRMKTIAKRLRRMERSYKFIQ